MMPAGLAMVVLSPVSGWALNRFGGRIVLMVGAGFMGVAYVFRVFATGSVAEIVLGATLVGVGAALAFASMPTLIMANVPITESASANGLNSLMRAVGGSSASAVLAAVLASVASTTAGQTLPSLDAFRDIYWVSGGTASVAFVLAALIPASRHLSPTSAISGNGIETVVHGRIIGAHGSLQDAAIVIVTRLDGEPIDWARTDSHGGYSVALPGAGRYLVVANARGWAPQAEVLDFREGGTELHMELSEELALTGVAMADGVPLARSLVLMHLGTGEFIASTHADEQGEFRFPLPAAGAYLLTVVDGDGEHAMSRKVVVTALASHVVLERGK
jgi:hypothetical protein